MQILSAKAKALHADREHAEACLEKAKFDLQVAQAAVKTYQQQVDNAKQAIAALAG